MQQRSCEVKSKSVVLGEAKWDHLETVTEAQQSLGDEQLLSLLNAQIKTNAMNALRTMETKGPTKSSLRTEAMSEIVQEISDAPGSFTDIIGNTMALEALITKRAAEIEERMKSAAAETITTGEE